jgi:hypothetical protein
MANAELRTAMGLLARQLRQTALSVMRTSLLLALVTTGLWSHSAAVLLQSSVSVSSALLAWQPTGRLAIPLFEPPLRAVAVLRRANAISLGWFVASLAEPNAKAARQVDAWLLSRVTEVRLGLRRHPRAGGAEWG